MAGVGGIEPRAGTHAASFSDSWTPLSAPPWMVYRLTRSQEDLSGMVLVSSLSSTAGGRHESLGPSVIEGVRGQARGVPVTGRDVSETARGLQVLGLYRSAWRARREGGLVH